MKRCSLLLLALALALLQAAPLRAEWEPDRRLTVNPATSLVSSNNARCLAASGDTIHVVWFDDRDGNTEIYYKRSVSGGANWGGDMRLTSDPASSHSPTVVASGRLVQVAWYDNRDGNWEIYYKRSGDGGLTWKKDLRLTSNPEDSKRPAMAVEGSRVHVTWMDRRDQNWEIYYKSSPNEGETWSDDRRITNNPGESRAPCIAAQDATVHIVWTDQRDGNPEIYYKRSVNNGETWGQDTRLTFDPGDSQSPVVAVAGSSVHVIWTDGQREDWGVFCRTSTDGGASWGEQVTLAGQLGDSTYPAFAISGANLHVVWPQLGEAGNDLYYRRSTDFGATWGSQLRLTDDPAESEKPHVAVAGSRVHVVWQDDRDGNFEIYYKRDPVGNVGIAESGDEPGPIPGLRRLRVLPNPFLAQARVPGHERELFALYDIGGRLVGNYPGGGIGAGAPPGVYLVTRRGDPTAVGRVVKVR